MAKNIRFHRVSSLPTTGDEGHVYFESSTGLLYIYANSSFEQYGEDYHNRVAAISSTSTDSQYPSAKAVYNAINSLTTEVNKKADKTDAGKTLAIDGTTLSLKNSSGTVLSSVTVPDDTHYTATLKVGANSSAKTNASVTSSTNSIYLNLIENNTVRDYHNIVGSGLTKVSSDASGKITISTPATTYGETAGSGSVGESNWKKPVTSVSLSAGHILSGISSSVPAATNSSDGYMTKELVSKIEAMSDPMIYKGSVGASGTITSLPTAASGNKGFVYKVNSDGTYASQVAKEGDLFISDGSSWILIPSGDEFNGTVTNIATGTGLTGGPITSTGTISHADTSSQASVSNTGRTYIQSITLDDMGHVTKLTSATETVANTDTKVTSVGNHYAPVENSGSQLNAATQTTKTDITSEGDTGTDVVVGIKRDDKGHVVGVVSKSIYSEDTKVTEVGNHYVPAGGSELTPTSSGTATRNSTVVMTGITRDAAGHITGVTGYKLPASDNTDTKNTAGSTNTSSKIYLVGATSQAANPQTYSHDSAYVGTDGHLYSNDSQVVNLGDSQTIVGAKSFTTKPVINLATTSNQTALDIITGDTDKFIRFGYNTTDQAGASWRVGMVGSGSSDTNYFSIQTGTSTTSATTWNPAVQFGQNTKDATFFGKIIKNGGTSSQFLMADGSVSTHSGVDNIGTVTGVAINANSPIVVDSNAAITTSGTRTISHATSGATAGSYGDSAAQTPAYGATFKVPALTVDSYGHVTAVSDHTVTIPASDNTDTKNTAGTSNKTNTKMYIVAATSQATNPTTNSNSNCYIGTDNCLYSGGTKVLTGNQSISFTPSSDGDITGTASGTTSLTPLLTIGDGRVTNAKLANPSVTIAGKEVSLGGSVTASELTTALGLSSAMLFKGTLGTGGTVTSSTNLGAASASNKGFTYKVITAGTYQGVSCKVGDTLVSDGSTWVLIPSGDEPDGTVTNVKMTVPTGLSVSGSPITTSGTLAVSYASGYSIPTTANQTSWTTAATNLGGHTVGKDVPSDAVFTDASVTAVENHYTPTGGSAATQTSGTAISWGGTAITGITIDAAGHITGVTKGAIPSNPNTDRYVNSASFAQDTTNNNLKMTLTRAGSDSTAVTANIPRANSTNGTTSYGVVKSTSTVTSTSGLTASPIINGVVYYKDTNTTYSAATTSAAGLMSAADKTKLNGIETGANNYSHPTGDGNLHVPATGTTNNGKVLTAGSTAGSLSWTSLPTDATTLDGHSASDFALSGHTHTTSLVSGGTSTISLSANTAYTLTAGGSSVVFKTPANTDTKNTTGSTNTSSKIYLVGATSQATNPTTYSDDELFVTSGALTTKSVAVGGGSATMQYDTTEDCIKFVFA